MTSSTPDALWSAPPARAMRPAGVAWSGLRRGALLDGCTLAVPVGTRLLVVSEPPASASLLIRVLAGLSPARGRIQIAGSSDASPDGWGRRTAYLGPEPGLRAWMTPRETLRLAAGLLGLAPVHAARRTDEVIAWTRIPAVRLDTPLGRGGPGLAQRTGLAAALLGDPEVLLFDEPLRALDADERTRLLNLPGARRTLLLASHYPASEAGLVTQVLLLRRGRVALVAPISELEAAGCTLSFAGIAALAELRAAASAQPSARHAALAR